MVRGLIRCDRPIKREVMCGACDKSDGFEAFRLLMIS